MRGAMPSGCRLTRSTLTRRLPAARARTPSSSTATARLPATSVPAAVDHDGRVRLVAAQDEVERLAHRPHLGVVERPLAVHRRVAGGQQQLVALAQRHLELLGQVQHHLAAGLGAAGLDEAHVPGRDAGVERQVELAAAGGAGASRAAACPRAGGCRATSVMAATVALRGRRRDYLGGSYAGALASASIRARWWARRTAVVRVSMS